MNTELKELAVKVNRMSMRTGNARKDGDFNMVQTTMRKELKDAVQLIAVEAGLSVNAVIRDALRHYVIKKAFNGDFEDTTDSTSLRIQVDLPFELGMELLDYSVDTNLSIPEIVKQTLSEVIEND